MKQCFKCQVVKPLDQFYAHPQMGDGHLNKCIACALSDAELTRTKNLANPHWVRKERERCREKSAKARAEGRLRPSPNELVNKQKWCLNNRQKQRAQLKARRAVVKGLIQKKEACEICGAVGRLEKHHEDYSKPLDVVWLCTKCHEKTRHIDDKLVCKQPPAGARRDTRKLNNET